MESIKKRYDKIKTKPTQEASVPSKEEELTQQLENYKQKFENYLFPNPIGGTSTREQKQGTEINSRSDHREDFNKIYKSIESLIEQRSKIKQKIFMGLFTRNKDLDQNLKELTEKWKQLDSIVETRERNYYASMEIKSGDATRAKERKDGRTNEDTSFTNDKNKCYGVFDGLGGTSKAYETSQRANKIIHEELANLPSDISAEDAKKAMKVILVKTHKAIRKAAQEDPDQQHRPGETTASVVKILGDGTAIIGHVGDCRVLRFTRSKFLKYNDSQVKEALLEHLTLDDNFVTEMNKKKHNKEKAKELQTQSANSSDRTLARDDIHGFILQSLGDSKKENINPNIYEYKLDPGDTLIITSDGVHDNLTDQEIASCIQDNPDDTSLAAKHIVDKAYNRSNSNHERAKKDDITAIVVTWGKNNTIG